MSLVNSVHIALKRPWIDIDLDLGTVSLSKLVHQLRVLTFKPVTRDLNDFSTHNHARGLLLSHWLVLIRHLVVLGIVEWLRLVKVWRRSADIDLRLRVDWRFYKATVAWLTSHLRLLGSLIWLRKVLRLERTLIGRLLLLEGSLVVILTRVTV